MMTALMSKATDTRLLHLGQMLMCLVFCLIASISIVAQVRTISTELHYLSGTGKDDAVLWDFFCTEGRNSGVWSKIRVPSNWETEGFGAYQYGGDHQRASNPFPKEQGKYKLNFDVPLAWKNRVVRLVFDGSMTDTEVWINGTSAGPVHQGSFYRFKYDITSLLKFGQTNLLEVTVSKESSNASVNNAERRGDYWNFGGIFRPVYLEALPGSFIDWTAIDARADEKISIDVNLGGHSSVGSRVVAQIVTPSGQPVGEPFSSEVLPDQHVARLQSIVTRPNLWTAETPNLYRVRITLLNGAKPVHTITERFGFRTFEVRKGDGLYLNGQRILLKGVNRHSFWPETGRALSKQISYDDVKLIKEMNMNAVRMSHYPPDAHFLEACDELGLYVLDELGGWHHSYDTPTGQRLIGQMIRRDVNHPSILFWDNGNEGGWNKDNDDEFARWDPQKREVLHPWEKFRLVNTDHYEKFDSHTRLSNGPDIYMPTEFLHGLYDGGIGAGMSDYWELIRTSKVGGGGFFWALLDECVKRTDQNGRLDCAGNRGPDGIVGPHREREGSFNTVREVWSPVQIKEQVNGASVKFDVENRFDFTNLNQCTFEWTLAQFPVGVLKGGHKVIAAGSLRAPNIGPHNSGQLQLTLPASRIRADVLYLTAKDPRGHELWTWSWSLTSFEPKPIVSTSALQLTDSGNLVSIRSGRIEVSISKERGTITRATIGGNPLLINNGPRVIAYRRNDRSYANVAGESRLTH
ncbi:MAG TPA: glycoside hydrolase family 2 TIM barrel-domain containing protein, partial [Pyrinomonadaceae bacterium]|nr:glycoside hydrolase family 2 TIM barrel-domain containing protein [Pyrinomonadaceae bacterium]